jgi:hypothetical protein
MNGAVLEKNVLLITGIHISRCFMSLTHLERLVRITLPDAQKNNFEAGDKKALKSEIAKAQPQSHAA